MLEWGKRNFRDLPWRKPGTPEWHFLIAEILLKREIGERAVQIWLELVKRYPTPGKLAKARRKTLVKLLKPLGLQNQRADALLALAKAIDSRYGGQVPPYAELLELPWVGQYTAGAVEVFCRRGRAQMLDPNILRVGTRFFGLPCKAAAEKQNIATRMLKAAPDGKEAEFYYAVLDLGAKICTKRPRCNICPLANLCRWALDNLNPVASS